MGVQKTYSYATGKGVAGGIYDMFHYPVDSRFNEEATGKLHFGVGVVTGKVPGSSVALPTGASTADNFEGVVINGFDRQQDLEGKGIADGIVANTTCITIDASELKRQAKEEE